MMDNEYITLRLRQEDKKGPDSDPNYKNIDMRDCSHLTLLAKIKDRESIES